MRRVVHIWLFAKSQHSLDQIFRQVFINTVVAASDSWIDAQFGQDLLWNLGNFGQHQFHFDLIWELPAPDLRHQVLTAIRRRLPQAQQAADFVMMQQAIVASLDLHWPWLVGTEQILLNAVEVRCTAAFEDESVV